MNDDQIAKLTTTERVLELIKVSNEISTRANSLEKKAAAEQTARQMLIPSVFDTCVASGVMKTDQREQGIAHLSDHNSTLRMLHKMASQFKNEAAPVIGTSATQQKTASDKSNKVSAERQLLERFGIV